MHVVGVPQIAPSFGAGTGNVLFDGNGADEDFGLEQVTGNRSDRYKFRTAPLRNLAVSPGYFRMLGAAVTQGREFGPADGSDVVMVNAAMAQNIWGSASPLQVGLLQ